MTLVGGDRRPSPTGVPDRADGAVRNAGSGRALRFWRSFTGYERRSNARTGWRLRPLLVFLTSGAVGVALSADVARGGPLLTVRWRLLAQLTVWALAWGAAVAASFRLPRRAAVLLILVVAVALRGAALAGPPTTTDDFYRYSWDGRVQAAGVNPYEYTPGSVHLTQLREPWLWPEERPCPLAYRPKDCTRINRSWVPTIYPPLAEAWFGGIYRLTGIEARWKPWQVAGLLTDVAVVALLAVALRRRGRDPRWCALYALCPAPVLEIVNNGHVDGLAILLAVAALAVAAPPRTGPDPASGAGSAAVAASATGCAAPVFTAVNARPAQPVAVARWGEVGGRAPIGSAARREVAAGALVGAAVLVKLFPLLLLVALVAASADRRRRALARVGGAAALVVGAGYLPHLLQVGTKVTGFLPGYLREEGYDGAGRYLVAGALGLPGEVAGLLSALAVVGAAGWVWTRRPSAPTGAAVLLGTLLLAASPVQPWYAVTLLAFAALAVEPKWSVIVAAGYPYFFAVVLLHPNRTGIGQLAYGLAAAAVAAPLLLRGSRAAAHSMEACPPSGC